jgi:hypothetical protein
MRIPHFIGGYVDLDGDGIFGTEAGVIGEMLNPALLTFPMMGEYKQPLDTEANLTPRPIKCSIAKAIEWMFRVRKWGIQIDIPSGPGSEFGAVNFDLENIAPPTDEVQALSQLSESGYVTMQFQGYSSEADVGDRSFEATAILDLFVRSIGELPADYEPYQVGNCTDPETDQILVTMRLRCTMAVYDNVTAEEWIATTDSWDDAEWDEYTDEGVTLDGFSFVTRWPWIGFTNGGNTYLESAPYLTINPVQWWEYSDGTHAIWDDATGEQLRSVLTGETI